MEQHNKNEVKEKHNFNFLYAPLNIIGATIWNMTSILPSIAYSGLASLKLSYFATTEIIDDIPQKQYKRAASTFFFMLSTPFVATLAAGADFFRFEAAAIYNAYDINFFGYTEKAKSVENPDWYKNGEMFVSQNKALNYWSNYITAGELADARTIHSLY